MLRNGSLLESWWCLGVSGSWSHVVKWFIYTEESDNLNPFTVLLTLCGIVDGTFANGIEDDVTAYSTEGSVKFEREEEIPSVNISVPSEWTICGKNQARMFLHCGCIFLPSPQFSSRLIYLYPANRISFETTCISFVEYTNASPQSSVILDPQSWEYVLVQIRNRWHEWVDPQSLDPRV